MKIREKLENLNWDDNIEHLVALAYLAGQEKATKEICDIHNHKIANMRKYAKNLRYHKMASSVIDAGQGDLIYSGHYAGDVTTELCDDEWPLNNK